jgi:taurine dioxygenase
MTGAAELTRPGHRIDTDGVEVIRLQPNIGAEIRGLDLGGKLTDALRDKLMALLLAHQVIFFRDQPIDIEQQKALGRLFGELEKDSMKGREVQTLVTGKGGQYYETKWHADATYRERPYFISILKSVVAPALGGDTVWSSGIAAYRSLSDEMKAKLSGLTALHTPEFKADLFIDDPAKRAAYLAEYGGAEHPVVIAHPLTGEKVLYVNAAFTQRIVGLPEEEGAELLAFLTSQFSRPENQVRFQWRAGSIAIWDNRAVQHYGVADYDPQPRLLERVVVQGGQPAA